MSWLCRFGSDASRYVVKLGDYHTKEQDDFERVLSPEHIEVHRKYRTESWEHDVALMRLKGAEGKCVSFNPHTNAACLPAPGSKWGKRPASCVITGWGMTGNVGFFLHGHHFGMTWDTFKNKIIYTHITCVLFNYIFTFNLFLWWQSWIFSSHYFSLQCHMTFQKWLWYADLELKKRFLLLSILKTVFAA